MIRKCHLCGLKQRVEPRELLDGGRCERCKEPVQAATAAVAASEDDLRAVSDELKVPLLAVFTSKACVYSKALRGHLDVVAERFTGKGLVLVVDVETNPGVVAHLGLTMTPSFVLVKGAQLLHRHDGVAEAGELVRWMRWASQPRAQAS